MSATELSKSLTQLHLPEFVRLHQSASEKCLKGKKSYEDYLQFLCDEELQARQTNKINRLLKASNLNSTKTIESFDQQNLDVPLCAKIRILREGHWVKKKENIIAFGTPGSGKTHLVAALAREMIFLGYSVYFTTCSNIVQNLLKCKRDFDIEKKFNSLRKIDVLILDDIGYTQQNEAEMEVLFQLLADRYEQASVMITSNLPFSKWEQIFKNPMTTAAAVDRLIHHCVVLEMNAESYRIKAALANQNK